MRFALLCLALMVFCGAGWQPNTGRPSPSRGVTIGSAPATRSGSSSSSYGNKSSSPNNSRIGGAVSGLQNAPVGRSADFYDKNGKYEGSVRKGATGFTTENSRHSFDGSMTKNPTGFSRYGKQGKYEGQIRINGKK